MDIEELNISHSIYSDGKTFGGFKWIVDPCEAWSAASD